MARPAHTIGSRDALFDIYPAVEKRSVSEHRHRFFELLLIRRGRAILTYRGRQHLLQPSQVHLCPPRAAHALEAEQETFENASIALYPELIRRIRGPRAAGPTGDEPLHALLADPPAVVELSRAGVHIAEELIHVLNEEYRLKLPGWRGQLASHAAELLTLLLRERRQIAVHPALARLRSRMQGRLVPQAIDQTQAHLPQNRIVAKAVQWMRADLSQRPNLASYARLIGVREKYLITLFTRVMGLSPQRYHMRLRLEAASQHLVNTTQTIDEVAARFGFPSRSHFSRQFRRQFGSSPGMYRDMRRLPD